MKKNIFILIAGIFILGPLFGVMLYLIDNQVSFKSLIMSSIVFGIALGEIFIFERLRNRNKKE